MCHVCPTAERERGRGAVVCGVTRATVALHVLGGNCPLGRYAGNVTRWHGWRHWGLPMLLRIWFAARHGIDVDSWPGCGCSVTLKRRLSGRAWERLLYRRARAFWKSLAIG